MVSYLVERAQPIVSEGSKSSVSKAKTIITWKTVSLMPFPAQDIGAQQQGRFVDQVHDLKHMRESMTTYLKHFNIIITS